jgi:hypothetical protein
MVHSCIVKEDWFLAKISAVHCVCGGCRQNSITLRSSGVLLLLEEKAGSKELVVLNNNC